MEKKSKHPGDVAKWIEKVIYSCTNVSQLLVAEKLISRFFILHGYSSPYSLHLNMVSEVAWNRLSIPAKQDNE